MRPKNRFQIIARKAARAALARRPAPPPSLQDPPYPTNPLIATRTSCLVVHGPSRLLVHHSCLHPGSIVARMLRVSPSRTSATGGASQGMWNTDHYGYPMDYAWWWIVLASLLVHAWCFFRLTKERGAVVFRLVAGNALVVLCLLQFAGLIGETYFRFFDMDTDSYGVSLSSKRWYKMHVRFNDLGHRDVPRAESKPEDVRRIAFVGDSFTFGWGIDRPEDRFADLIRDRFDERDPAAVEVLTAAKDGWETGDEMEEIGRLIDAYGVDEIVLCYCLNDIHDVLPAEMGFLSLYPSDGHLLNTDGSYLMNHLYHRWVAHRSVEVTSYFDRLAAGYEDPASWRLQQTRFDWIIDRCRGSGVTLRVVILPFVNVDVTAPARAKVAAHFAAAGAEVLDLAGSISGQAPATLVVNRYDHHPNERAHRIYADAIWKAYYQEARK